ncbi:LLM class flavin-dependent oxidoreductase [Halomarina halobia]|uniref:LLM class flavin-dependent oxidoreductase n=1 Tax=Halomarina halobia TaxID=3033386 RepID=A0ABD6AEQ2_9EURY|nr:LLM class flavin-dependent oxidoreductase [Halomarina sp. PSR21]
MTFEYPRTGLVLPEYAAVEDDWLVDFAVRAADAGFDSVWCGEGWGYNPFQLLARVGERTDVCLGTCIANVFARSPTALAANALALHDLTGGRFVLGLGTSTPQVVEAFHGGSFERPLRRLRETIEIVDLALSGERIDYDGEVFSLRGFALNHADGDEVPIFNAALGPTNVALTIDFADGLLPHVMPLPALESVIARGEERAHSAANLHVSPSVPTSVSADPAEAERVLAKHVAYYAGSTDFYNDVIASNGFRDEAEAIRSAWRGGDTEGAAAAVSRDLVDAVGIAGTPDDARERVRELLDGTVDTALLSFPQGATDEMFELALEALPEEERP